MSEAILSAISVISGVCAIVFGYIAFVRNRDSDKTKEAKSDATILTELGYIRNSGNSERQIRIPSEGLFPSKHRRNRRTNELTISNSRLITNEKERERFANEPFPFLNIRRFSK